MCQCGFVIKTWRCINRVVSWQEAARRSVFIEASAIAHDSIIIITLNVTIYLHNLLLPDSTNFIHIDNKELIKAKLLHSIGIQLLFSFVLVPEKVHVTLIFLLSKLLVWNCYKMVKKPTNILLWKLLLFVWFNKFNVCIPSYCSKEPYELWSPYTFCCRYNEMLVPVQNCCSA